MFVASLFLNDFRGVGTAQVEFLHPDRGDAGRVELPNINVLVGQNGGGKSTVLKGITSALFAGEIEAIAGDSVRGWPRYGSEADCYAFVDIVEHYEDELADARPIGDLNTTGRQHRVGLRIPRDLGEPVAREVNGQLADIDTGTESGFFGAYGPNRQVAATDPDVPSQALSRDRVATLFDQAAILVPLEAWLPMLDADDPTSTDRVSALEAMLPPDVQFRREYTNNGYLFIQRDVEVPRTALSDGMQSYLAWVCDLLYRLHEEAGDREVRSVSGTVLVDEIDQRMHPRWQQTLLAQLSRGLPRIQFICTAHSPLIAGGLRPQNLVLLEPDPNASGEGAMTAARLTEDIYGRTADQVLTSSYFGLQSSRSDVFAVELQALARDARGGDRDAAVRLMRRLAQPSDSDVPIKSRPIQPRRGWWWWRRRRRSQS